MFVNSVNLSKVGFGFSVPPEKGAKPAFSAAVTHQNILDQQAEIIKKYAARENSLNQLYNCTTMPQEYYEKKSKEIAAEKERALAAIRHF